MFSRQRGFYRRPERKFAETPRSLAVVEEFLRE